MKESVQGIDSEDGAPVLLFCPEASTSPDGTLGLGLYGIVLTSKKGSLLTMVDQQKYNQKSILETD